MVKLQEDQLGHMVDNRLIPTKMVSDRFFKQHGLTWFLEPENQDYFPEEMIKVYPEEVEQFRRVSGELFDLAMQAADHVIQNNRWSEVGIPSNMQNLVSHSFAHERANYLIGRFDFAGGLGIQPLKLLEFNGDTCSLMPETHYIQDWQKKQIKSKHGAFDQFNHLLTNLTISFKALLQRYPEKEPTLLLSGMGHEEDWLNLEIIELAAKQAGFLDVQHMVLPQVIFSPDEGLFVEVNPQEFRRYDFWFKMIPWEWIAYDEPELLDLLEAIVKNDLAVILNPAYAMLLQSKGLMSIMHELSPNHPNLLQTSNAPHLFKGKPHIQKPIFGRMGDNIQLFINNSQRPDFQSDGDYQDFPAVYQAFTQLDQDEDGDIYQPSVYFSSEPSALCFRRQDELIINDDAEFVGHVIPK